jgi:hypothetical protein
MVFTRKNFYQMGYFKVLILALILSMGRTSAAGKNLVESKTTLKNISDDINRPAFYKAIRENDKTAVKSQLSDLQKAPEGIREAFIGAMTMKEAGLSGDPHSKLSLFKKGRKMLEAAIRLAPDNAEYRFLRLIVQENAPGILGYHNDIEKDSEYIRKCYKLLPNDVQQAIVDYNKKSKNLKLGVS